MGIYERIVSDDLDRMRMLERAIERCHLGEVGFGASSTARFRTPPRGRPARTGAGIRISGCAVERRSGSAGRRGGKYLSAQWMLHGDAEIT